MIIIAFKSCVYEKPDMYTMVDELSTANIIAWSY